MKTKKILALILVAVLAVGIMASCSTVKKTTVQITFIDNNGKKVIDTYDAVLKMENPTVMDAVKAVKDAYATAEEYGQIKLSSDESSVVDVDSYKESLSPDADGNIKYWMFLVNGEEPTGDANDVKLADKDTIVFQYFVGPVEKD